MVDFNIDRINNYTIVVAPERSKRPRDEFNINSISVKNCQFCPGNEHLTPADNYSVIGNNQEWTVRAFPNKFPAFMLNGNTEMSGIQEVIVETNDHFLKFEKYTKKQLCDVLDTFKNRIESIKSETDIKYIVVFKNDGKLSGATLEHPHSQIVGLTFIPDNIRLKNNKLREYYHSRGDCYYCSLINNSNIVFKSDSFICIMPDEARFSYETWIIPGKHEAYFENLSQIEKSDLAEVLQKTIKSTNILLDNPSFNLVMHNGTYKEESNNKYMHWHFQLIPRTTFLAGFEWATGIYVRHVDHKQASTQLKELILNN